MIKKFKLFLVFVFIISFYALYSSAQEVNPFGTFTYIKPSTESVISSENEGAGIPTQRYKLNKYFVKGTVIIVGSPSKSFAIVSYYPGGQDYVLQKSHPLGNESHVIIKITSNYIVVRNMSTKETREIPVQNLSPSVNLQTNMSN